MAKLGAAANVLHESQVEANNWMSALRAAREALSERPSVPPGASCSIDAQGVATVLDPGSRRKFVLEPVGAAEVVADVAAASGASAAVAAAQQPAVAPPQPRKRFETVPLVPEAQQPPAAPPVAVGGPAVAAMASANTQPAPATDGTAAKKKRFDTVAFTDARPAAPAGAASIAVTGAAPQPQPKAASAAANVAPANAAPQQGNAKAIAGVPSRAPVAGTAVAAPAAAPAAAHAPASVAQAAAAQAQPAMSAARTPSGDAMRSSLKPLGELELLLTRDEEPTAENPLCYRERAYLLPRGATVPEAEAALRWKLADLKKTIESRPRGKLVHLAVFDHRWQDIPDRPPVIALEWRDWRSDVVVDYPAATRVSSLPPPSRPNDDHLPEVFEALGELARLHTAAEGLDFAVRLLGRTIPSQAISACLYDINTDELRFVAVAGTNAELMQGHAVPRAAGLFGLAARVENQASVFADVLVEPVFDPEIDSRPGLEARNMLLRPLAHERQLMGMLQLINRGGAGTFSAQDVNAINYVAERLAEYLHLTRMQPRAPA